MIVMWVMFHNYVALLRFGVDYVRQVDEPESERTHAKQWDRQFVRPTVQPKEVCMFMLVCDSRVVYVERFAFYIYDTPTSSRTPNSPNTLSLLVL